MNVLLRHFEKILLGAALLALLVCLWLFLQNLHSITQQVHDLRENAIDVPEGKIPAVTDADFPGAALLSSPNLLWSASAGGGAKTVFSPRTYIFCANPDCPYILAYDTEICPHCGTPQGAGEEPTRPANDKDMDEDGLPRDYENQYEFLSDEVAADASQDQDDDLFTNLEEFAAGTEPDNPGDHPPLAEKTRFLNYQKRRLPLQLYQVKTYGKTDKESWDIFITTGKGQRSERTRIFSIGDELVDGRYSIKEVTHTSKTVFDETINSERVVETGVVTLTDNRSGKTITLQQGQRPLSSNLYITLVYLTDPRSAQNSRRINTKVGDSITLQDTVGNSERYLVRFLGQRNAPALQPVQENDEASGELIPILRFNPARDLRRAPDAFPDVESPETYDLGMPPRPVEF